VKRFFRRVLARLGYKPMGKITVSAVLIHEDGSTEDLGQVAEGRVELKTEAG
jgi:hypothetical protein